MRKKLPSILSMGLGIGVGSEGIRYITDGAFDPVRFLGVTVIATLALFLFYRFRDRKAQ